MTLKISKNTIEETSNLITELQKAEELSNKPKAKMSTTSKIVFVISLIVFIGSSVFLANSLIKRHNNIEMNSELYSEIVEENDDGSQYFNFAELKEKNPDFVGWIHVSNTNVSLPVVQCDDNSYYLKHDFYKKYDYRGTVFMDYRNNPESFDASTILYGHNCYDGTMFSDLEKFQDIEFYKENPIIDFYTQNSTDKWKIYAVFVTSAKADEDNGYIFNYIYPFMDGDNFTGFINEVNKRRLYVTDVDITDDDNMLILSTCIRALDLWKNGKQTYRADARLVIVARKVRAGESNEVNTQNVTLNPTPKYPQLWYDKNGTKNPYANDERWYPQKVVSK